MSGLHTLADIILAARYLKCFDTDVQASKCAALIASAKTAAEHVKITGKTHALYGDGSLSALALRSPLAGFPARLDRETLEALSMVIDQLTVTVKPRKNSIQTVKSL